MIAMFVGECVNFPIQRNFVFRSKGNVWYQALWYLIAFCIITCIVNSVNCVWVAVAGLAASRQNHTLPARPGQPFDLDDAPGEAEDFV